MRAPRAALCLRARSSCRPRPLPASPVCGTASWSSAQATLTRNDRKRAFCCRLQPVVYRSGRPCAHDTHRARPRHRGPQQHRLRLGRRGDRCSRCARTGGNHLRTQRSEDVPIEKCGRRAGRGGFLCPICSGPRVLTLGTRHERGGRARHEPRPEHPRRAGGLPDPVARRAQPVHGIDPARRSWRHRHLGRAPGFEGRALGRAREPARAGQLHLGRLLSDADPGRPSVLRQPACDAGRHVRNG